MEEMLSEIQNIANEAAYIIAAPNWADKLLFISSLLAIVAAIFVAHRQNGIVLKQAEIAEQQNKIALFEKRYTVYENVSKVVRVANEIVKSNHADDIWDAFQNVFVDEYSHSETEDINSWRMSFILNIHGKLEQAEFLFSEDISDAILLLRVNLLLFARRTYAESDDETFEERKMMFYQVAKNIETNKILERIREDLRLQSIKL